MFNQWLNGRVGLNSIQWSSAKACYYFDSTGMTKYLWKSAAFKIVLILEILGFLLCSRSLTVVKIIIGVCCITLIVLIGLFGDYLLYRDGHDLIRSVNFLFENYRGLLQLDGETDRIIFNVNTWILSDITYHIYRFSSISSIKVFKYWCHFVGYITHDVYVRSFTNYSRYGSIWSHHNFKYIPLAKQHPHNTCSLPYYNLDASLYSNVGKDRSCCGNC